MRFVAVAAHDGQADTVRRQAFGGQRGERRVGADLEERPYAQVVQGREGGGEPDGVADVVHPVAGGGELAGPGG